MPKYTKKTDTKPPGLVSLSNLMSRGNERISCENLEKYGGLLS